MKLQNIQNLCGTFRRTLVGKVQEETVLWFYFMDLDAGLWPNNISAQYK